MSTALSKSQEIYENMLKNPKNRTSSSGQVKQPSPFEDAEIRGGNIDTSKIEESQDPKAGDVSQDEQNYLSEIDRRMKLRKEGKMAPPADTPAGAHARVDESRIDKIENQVKEIQDLLMEIMKAQMKLLNG